MERDGYELRPPKETYDYESRSAMTVVQIYTLAKQLRQSLGTTRNARVWLHQSNACLGDFTPAFAIKTGKSDLVFGLLHALDYGMPFTLIMDKRQSATDYTISSN